MLQFTIIFGMVDMDNLKLKKQFITFLNQELKKVKIKFRDMRDEIIGEDLSGIYNPSSNTIWVNKKIKDKKYIKEIILHEFFEWMLWKVFKNTQHYWEANDNSSCFKVKIDYDETYYVVKHGDIDKIVKNILEKR